MTRSCVRDREARKQTSMHVLEKSEPVIKCDAIMIERLGAEDQMIKRLGTEDEIMKRLGTEDEVIKRLGTKDQIIKRLGTDDEIIKRLGTEDKMIKRSGTEDTVIGCHPTTTIEAILIRDQRTTIHRVFDRSIEPDTVLSLTTSGGKSTAASSTRCRPEITRVNLHPVPNTRTWKNDGRTYSKVSSADPFLVTRSRYNRRIPSPRLTTTVFPLLRLASLLFAFLIISANGAPMSLQNKNMQSTQKWKSPCGEAGQTSVDYDGDQDVEQISDKQLIAQISMQARTALMHAELFLEAYLNETMRTYDVNYKDRFYNRDSRKLTGDNSTKSANTTEESVKHTFNSELKTLQSEWRKSRYTWLPSLIEIPKHFKEDLDQEYLDQFDISMLDNILLKAYSYMQKFAVGLEQIVWDQEYYNGKFQEQFKQSELNLRAVLCMLQTAIMERAVSQSKDVGRDIMASEFRNMKAETYRNLRDWLIFRDYLNGLEFILQVFKHLDNKLTS